jgi:hypothetical protein
MPFDSLTGPARRVMDREFRRRMDHALEETRRLARTNAASGARVQ